MRFLRNKSISEILSAIAEEIGDICSSIESTGLMESLEHCAEAESIVQDLISKRKFSAEDIAKAFDKVIYELSFAVSTLTQEFIEIDEKITWCNTLGNS